MFVEKISENVNKFGTAGVVISTEKKSSLQTSLLILKKNNKFDNIALWGIINGTKDDYYIAEGSLNSDLFSTKIFYSKDCVTWGLLTDVVEENKVKSRKVKGRFTGDPTNEYEIVEIVKTVNGDEVVEQEQIIMIKEEERLSTIIADISFYTKIVPFKAFVKDAKGKVVKNRTFQGLEASDAQKIKSYYHFRESENIKSMSIIEKSRLNPIVDFMDSISMDKISGTWNMLQNQTDFVVLRSLLWLGFVFYHVPETTNYGSIYVGTGEKNIDIPFMLC